MDAPTPPLPPPDEVWLVEGARIADKLIDSAVVGDDGSFAWFQPAWPREHMLDAPRRELNIIDSDLYDGALGVALFLAAASKVSGQWRYRSAAIGAVQGVLLAVKGRGRDFSDHIGIGGLTGLGSVVYGLVTIGALLEMPELVSVGERAAELITNDRIDGDVALDVTQGTAGALLGLLRLYGATASRSALGAAKRCGHRLVAALRPLESAPHAKRARILGADLLTGFSHGASGIAYALGKLHAITGEPDLITAATHLVRFERNTFSREQRDWPDLRVDVHRFVSSWCHGAPGIGLSRIASREWLDDAAASDEIEIAIGNMRRSAPNENGAHICCGSLGVVDILVTAGQLLNRRSLRDEAELLALQEIQASRSCGHYELGLPSVDGLYSPSLFQGLAGVGYALLRLAREDLPTVLLMD